MSRVAAWDLSFGFYGSSSESGYFKACLIDATERALFTDISLILGLQTLRLTEAGQHIFTMRQPLPATWMHWLSLRNFGEVISLRIFSR